NHPIALLRVEDEGLLVQPPAAAPKVEEMRASASRPIAEPNQAGIAAGAIDDRSAEEVLQRIAQQIRQNGRGGHDGKRMFASPLRRRLARELGLELGRLNGSGPHGRIIKVDVERAARETMRPAEQVAAAEAEVEPSEEAQKRRPRELVARSEA